MFGYEEENTLLLCPQFVCCITLCREQTNCLVFFFHMEKNNCFHKMHFQIYAVTDASPQGSRRLITGLLDGCLQE